MRRVLGRGRGVSGEGRGGDETSAVRHGEFTWGMAERGGDVRGRGTYIVPECILPEHRAPECKERCNTDAGDTQGGGVWRVLGRGGDMWGEGHGADTTCLATRGEDARGTVERNGCAQVTVELDVGTRGMVEHDGGVRGTAEHGGGVCDTVECGGGVRGAAECGGGAWAIVERGGVVRGAAERNGGVRGTAERGGGVRGVAERGGSARDIVERGGIVRGAAERDGGVRGTTERDGGVRGTTERDGGVRAPSTCIAPEWGEEMCDADMDDAQSKGTWTLWRAAGCGGGIREHSEGVGGTDTCGALRCEAGGCNIDDGDTDDVRGGGVQDIAKRSGGMRAAAAPGESAAGRGGIVWGWDSRSGAHKRTGACSTGGGGEWCNMDVDDAVVWDVAVDNVEAVARGAEAEACSVEMQTCDMSVEVCDVEGETCNTESEATGAGPCDERTHTLRAGVGEGGVDERGCLLPEKEGDETDMLCLHLGDVRTWPYKWPVEWNSGLTTWGRARSTISAGRGVLRGFAISSRTACSVLVALCRYEREPRREPVAKHPKPLSVRRARHSA